MSTHCQYDRDLDLINARLVYTDRAEIAKLSRLKTKDIYNAFNSKKGKKNHLIIIRKSLEVLKKRNQSDKTIERLIKKFLP